MFYICYAYLQIFEAVNIMFIERSLRISHKRATTSTVKHQRHIQEWNVYTHGEARSADRGVGGRGFTTYVAEFFMRTSVLCVMGATPFNVKITLLIMNI